MAAMLDLTRITYNGGSCLIEVFDDVGARLTSG